MLFFPLTLWGFSTFTFEAMVFCYLFLIASGDSPDHASIHAFSFLGDSFPHKWFWAGKVIIGGRCSGVWLGTDHRTHLNLPHLQKKTKRSVLKIPTSEEKTHSNQISSTKPDYSVPPLVGYSETCFLAMVYCKQGHHLVLPPTHWVVSLEWGKLSLVRQ